MIKLENTEVLGWEAAIRGMRNPMNSWEKSDSLFFGWTVKDSDGESVEDVYLDILGDFHGLDPYSSQGTEMELGNADHKLMMNLAKAGSVDAKYRRMIVVTVDITAPLYWWKEFDTYKIGTVANSCSTMNKIHAKEFDLEDFSCEHLMEHADIEMPDEYPADQPLEIGDAPVVVRGFDDNYHDMIFSPLGGMRLIVEMLNRCRELFIKTKDKRYWWQMIQLLPSSYNQRRTVMLNYEVLAGIYPKRKDHKLDEWHEFCDWIKSLPYSEIITLEEEHGGA